MEELVTKNNTMHHGLHGCWWKARLRRRSMAKALALSFVALAVLIAATPAAATEYPITIVDSAGNTIVIEEPVERIVTLTTDAAEVIRAIGAADKVVGVSKYVVQDEVFFLSLIHI